MQSSVLPLVVNVPPVSFYSFSLILASGISTQWVITSTQANLEARKDVCFSRGLVSLLRSNFHKPLKTDVLVNVTQGLVVIAVACRARRPVYLHLGM